MLQVLRDSRRAFTRKPFIPQLFTCVQYPTKQQKKLQIEIDIEIDIESIERVDSRGNRICTCEVERNVVFKDFTKHF